MLRTPGISQRLTMALAMGLALFIVGLTTRSAVMAGPVSPALIYGVGVDNKIYRVDAVTQAISLVEPSLSTGVKANGFATDRSRNQLFYFGSNGDLYFYDILSGSEGTVALASTFGNNVDFPPEDATYYNGAFWYIGKGDNANNKLYQATLAYAGNVPSFTGAPVEYQLTASGSTSGMAFGDIAVNDNTGILYGSTTPESGGLFFSINMATLTSGTSNALSVLTSGNAIGLQLAFSADYSTLYGQKYNYDPGDPTNPALTTGEWYTVDSSSGIYSAISGFTTTPGMRDLAGVAAVPEPGTLALGGVGIGGAALLGWERRRRRRVKRGGFRGDQHGTVGAA